MTLLKVRQLHDIIIAAEEDGSEVLWQNVLELQFIEF